MKITRSGASANHGFNSIDIDSPDIKWNKDKKQIELRKYNIKDFTSGSRHDYLFTLSLSEIRQLISVVGDDAASTNASDICNAFSQYLRDLKRIEQCCIGSIGDKE